MESLTIPEQWKQIIGQIFCHKKKQAATLLANKHMSYEQVLVLVAR